MASKEDAEYERRRRESMMGRSPFAPGAGPAADRQRTDARNRENQRLRRSGRQLQMQKKAESLTKRAQAFQATQAIQDTAFEAGLKGTSLGQYADALSAARQGVAVEIPRELLETGKDSYVYLPGTGVQAPLKSGGLGFYKPGEKVARPPALLLNEEGRKYYDDLDAQLAQAELGQTRIPRSMAQNLPLHWMQHDQKQLTEFVQKGLLMKHPDFRPGMDMDAILGVWNKLVNTADLYNQGGMRTKKNKYWTPFDVLEVGKEMPTDMGTYKANGWIYDAATGERLEWIGGKGAPSLTQTETSTQVDLSSPEQVRALANTMLNRMLGRAATAEEVGMFKASLNSYEEANPQQTTTTVSLIPQPGDASVEQFREGGRKTVTSGGVTADERQQLVEGEVKQTSEYGSFQAATTYWDAIMSAIRGVGG